MDIRREVLIAASPGVFSPDSIWWGDLVVRRADALVHCAEILLCRRIRCS
jgi:hypothetical protein